MSKPVKVALVGISGYGASYVDALLNNESRGTHELVACVDTAPQRSRHLATLRERGCPIYPTMAGLLAAHPDVELVMLATPIHLHASQTCDALAAGASVLCEKPLAGSLRDARRILAAAEAARAKGRFVAIGYQWSFSRAVQALKRDILGGRLGRPLRLRSWVAFPRDIAYFRRNDWAGRVRTPAGDDVFDSPVNNATAHYLHNMLYLLGTTRESSATPLAVTAELYRANDIENFDTAAMRCEMDGGAQVLFYTTHSVPDRVGPRCIFEFEHASVSYDHLDGGTFVAHFDDGRTVTYGCPEKDRDAKIWQAIDAVCTGERLACDPAAALPHVLCVSAAQRSKPIPLPADTIRIVSTETGPMVTVDGLGTVLENCFTYGTLPSELGNVEWAQPAQRVRLLAAEIESDVAVAERTVALPA